MVGFMNKALILRVQELESKYLLGLISKLRYEKELNQLLEGETDKETIGYIKSKLDLEI